MEKNFSGRASQSHQNQSGGTTSWSEKESLELKNESLLPRKSTAYEGNVCEQPPTRSRAFSLDAFGCFSGCDPYFAPATGLDFLLGVPEVLLLQTAGDMTSSSGSKFLVRIPKGETLYLGAENSSAVQKALLCSGRNFSMALLDLANHEAATFVRKAGLLNIGTCFRQEMVVRSEAGGRPIGRVIQDNTLSAASFTIFDDKSQALFRILGSKNVLFGTLNEDVHFSILDPVHRTGGVIIHKWDSECNNFLYHIVFPSCGTSVHSKMLLLGAAIMVEYTYFKKSGWSCFS